MCLTGSLKIQASSFKWDIGSTKCFMLQYRLSEGFYWKAVGIEKCISLLDLDGDLFYVFYYGTLLFKVL
jgi:hypothetical protein